MIGQTLGHCRILEKIGAGGMGVVHRARDERLARDIAVNATSTTSTPRTEWTLWSWI